MEFNYSKLKGRIKEILDTQEAFGKAVGMSHVTISSKLNNKIEFTQSEILKSIEVLGLEVEDIPTYFFNQEVKKTQLKE